MRDRRYDFEREEMEWDDMEEHLHRIDQVPRPFGSYCSSTQPVRAMHSCSHTNASTQHPHSHLQPMLPPPCPLLPLRRLTVSSLPVRLDGNLVIALQCRHGVVGYLGPTNPVINHSSRCNTDG